MKRLFSQVSQENRASAHNPEKKIWENLVMNIGLFSLGPELVRSPETITQFFRSYPAHSQMFSANLIIFLNVAVRTISSSKENTSKWKKMRFWGVLIKHGGPRTNPSMWYWYFGLAAPKRHTQPPQEFRPAKTAASSQHIPSWHSVGVLLHNHMFIRITLDRLRVS